MEKRKVEILPVKDGTKHSCPHSFYESLFNVIHRLERILRNSFLWIWSGRDMFFFIAFILKEKSNEHRFFCYVPTLLKNYAIITDPNCIEAILKHDRNETGENVLFGGGFPSITSQRILGDNLLSFTAKSILKCESL